MPAILSGTTRTPPYVCHASPIAHASRTTFDRERVACARRRIEALLNRNPSLTHQPELSSGEEDKPLRLAIRFLRRVAAAGGQYAQLSTVIGDDLHASLIAVDAAIDQLETAARSNASERQLVQDASTVKSSAESLADYDKWHSAYDAERERREVLERRSASGVRSSSRRQKNFGKV